MMLKLRREAVNVRHCVNTWRNSFQLCRNLGNGWVVRRKKRVINGGDKRVRPGMNWKREQSGGEDPDG